MDRWYLNADPRTWHGVARPTPGSLLVSEIFGPTLQGEGPNAGQAAMFVRLGGCNLTCGWCDTRYAWDASSFNLSIELREIPTSTVTELASAPGVPLVVLTGGEPALQATEAAVLAANLRARQHLVHLETSGTVSLGPLADVLDLIVVSPKLANSGLRDRQRLRMPVLKELASHHAAVFKFVVEGIDDLDEVEAITNMLGLAPTRVWIMPEADNQDVLMERLLGLAQPTADHGWSLSNRLHILLWGSQRGR